MRSSISQIILRNMTPARKNRDPMGQRMLEIHPTLRCNLRCEHCYSVSGPWQHDELDFEIVERVLTDAARMGYEVVSVSGGEPFLCRGLKDILRQACALGMRTIVVTNGYFLDPSHLEPLTSYLDMLSISLDGPPEIHNRMRGSPRAFDHLCAGLEHVRSSGVPFGFIHTITRASWKHLSWVAEFAKEGGAHLLQLRPLELIGRAETNLKELALRESVLLKVYQVTSALEKKYAGMMDIQTRLLHRDQIFAAPETVYAGEMPSSSYGTVAASQLGVLVLERDGALVPLSYGFSRRYQVVNAVEGRLATAWPAFFQDTYPAFRRLCRSVFDRLMAPDAPQVFNWYEQIAARSHQRLTGATTA
jgi:molybdenum cofactor biosynthesis enzyme MoaA